MRPTRLFAVLLPSALALVVVLTAAAAEDQPAKSRELDGKELFKTQCKVCHGPKAAAGTYTPMTLISEQWSEFFDATFAESHAKVAAPDTTGHKSVPEALDKDTLEAIRKFCVDHAADSEQPMTCG